jgi:hypothetical protein
MVVDPINSRGKIMYILHTACMVRGEIGMTCLEELTVLGLWKKPVNRKNPPLSPD